MPNFLGNILDALKDIAGDSLPDIAKDKLLEYLEEQKADAKLYCSLARKAGWNKDATNKANAFELAWKGVRWALQHPTPTIEAVKADLKLK